MELNSVLIGTLVALKLVIASAVTIRVRCILVRSEYEGARDEASKENEQ